MLCLNVPRVMALRGIKRPYSFLRENGFTHHMSIKLGTAELRQVDLALLSKLCVLLNCTPHDLLDTCTTSKAHSIDQHPLAFLKKNTNGQEFHKVLRSMPLDHIERIAQQP
jgi:DNA-binding Xre family transcriptional regulator